MPLLPRGGALRRADERGSLTVAAVSREQWNRARHSNFERTFAEILRRVR